MRQPNVIQLQDLASSSDHDIADLLRKALVVATKLQLPEFRQWILSELNGYEDRNGLPDYRIIHGDLRAQNPYHGLVPFIIQESEIRDLVTKIHLHESVSSIQQLVHSKGKGEICFYFGPEQEAALMRMQGYAPLRPLRLVGANQLLAVLQVVRTRILEWALSLEAEGIVGDGLSFSDGERQKAMTSKSIRIENFQGILGDVHGGTISQTNSMTVLSGNYESLANFLKQQGIPFEHLPELASAIDADPKPKAANSFGPKVSTWIGRMVSLAASGGWEVSIATAGTLLAAAISKYYGL